MDNTELLEIGMLRKTHGNRGELQCFLSIDVIDDVEPDFVFIEIDNTFIPFRLNEYRYKSDDIVLLTFNGIDTEEKAEKLCGKKVLIEKLLIGDIAPTDTPKALIGFLVVDAQNKQIGNITDIDDTTSNLLMRIDNDIVLPLHEDLILNFDDTTKTLTYKLPQGLLDL